jgi:hypothetical protein
VAGFFWVSRFSFGCAERSWSFGLQPNFNMHHYRESLVVLAIVVVCVHGLSPIVLPAGSNLEVEISDWEFTVYVVWLFKTFEKSSNSMRLFVKFFSPIPSRTYSSLRNLFQRREGARMPNFYVRLRGTYIGEGLIASPISNYSLYASIDREKHQRKKSFRFVLYLGRHVCGLRHRTSQYCCLKDSLH